MAEKILVVQTSFLGDTVLTLPLAWEIRRRFPRAEVTLLCTRAGKELLEGHPAIDRIVVDDKRGLDRGWLGLWRKAAFLRAQRFSIAITPHKSLRTALLLFLAGIPRRIGFRDSRGWFLFHSTAIRHRQAHDVERNLSVLQGLGVAPAECQRRLEFPSRGEDREAADRLLRAAGVDPARTLIGINPGSVWPTKQWTTAGFADLVRLLKRDLDCEVLIFGGPEDAAAAAEIEARCGGLAVNLAGKTSLRVLAAALGACQLLVTNDSGPMHIAVAQGVPVVAVFCATTPSLGFFPYSSRAIVVEKDLSCRPCASHGGKRCPLGTHDCSALIKADDVFESARELLASSGIESREEHRPRWRVV